MNKRYTLLELNSLVRRNIELTMPDDYWVEAELSEVRESRGHCYMEMVQKDERTATPVAKASAKCWRQTWVVVRQHFERATGQQLRAGMKVLVSVYPQFHEAYGFSWIVTDIDPTYTLGDMARKRQEIVATLKAEGVFDLNRELPFPMFAQRIAVVSSATAAGYGDFCAQLADNDYGFRFDVRLFPAVMQGESVEGSIISALNSINDEVEQFDCVVIIRGGGATSDMSGFDTLALAENVANFPLPVITGIGHDRDESVLDMVAHTRVKTPTAAAVLLIDNLRRVADSINDLASRMQRTVAMRMDYERQRLVSSASRLPVLFMKYVNDKQNKLHIATNKLTTASLQATTNALRRIDNSEKLLAPLIHGVITRNKHRMEMLEQRLTALDPQLLLRRGYSITLHNGKAVRDAASLNIGDVIVTRVERGIITSTITPQQ